MSCGCLRTRTSSSGDLPRPSAPADTNGDLKKPDDPRIPLNTRQKFTLIKNWKGISRQATETGANMFVKMLSENPELYDMFPFRGLKDAEKNVQLEDEVLQLHGEAVMNVFDQAIQAVEDADAFFAVLERNGRSHATKPNFTPDLFWKMEQPFLYAVKLTLDERYTDNMDAVYRVVIKLILETMEQSCRKAMPDKS